MFRFVKSGIEILLNFLSEASSKIFPPPILGRIVSTLNLDYRKFREDICSELTRSSLYRYSDHFHSCIENVGTRNPASFDYSINQTNKSTILLSLQDPDPYDETQEPT
jgi:hypothetical protein